MNAIAISTMKPSVFLQPQLFPLLCPLTIYLYRCNDADVSGKLWMDAFLALTHKSLLFRD